MCRYHGQHLVISNLPNLLSRKDLLRELVAAELRSSTAQTRLGWLWWLLDPLLMMVIYWLIVVELLGKGRENYYPYWVFIFFGLITWRHFSTSAGKAAGVLSGRQTLIRTVPFPTMLLPIATVLSSFFFFLCAMVVLGVMAILAPKPHHSGDLLPLIQLPALLLLQLTIVTGVALILSCLGVLYRDLGELVPHLLRAGFYLSPGLYGVDLVKSAIENRFSPDVAQGVFSLYMLNPFAILITGYRSSIFYGDYLAWPYWIVLMVEAVGLMVVGYLVYQHYDRRVIKFL
jgi:ABC-type polysaccharide/polyol phosphate export permease